MATSKCVAEFGIIGFLAVFALFYFSQRMPLWKRSVSRERSFWNLNGKRSVSRERSFWNLNGTRTAPFPNSKAIASQNSSVIISTGPQPTEFLTLILPLEDAKDSRLLSDHTFRINPSFKMSTCPISLQMKMKQDWMSEKYHPEIRLLMNEKLLNRQEYDRLLQYYIPYGYNSHPSPLPYDDLARVLSLFPAAQSIFDFSADRKWSSCLRCAVVGNGGILNGSARGIEIDDHHMVFRVNNALRRGHESDVGNRTTHYFFFDRSLRNLDKKDVPRDKGIKYVFIPCERNDYSYIKRVVNGQEPKLHADAEDIRILHPDFIRYVQRIWMELPQTSHYFRPTTGSLMLLTALHAGCDYVQVYGMGYQPKYTLYYFDKEFQRYNIAKAVHNVKREIAVLRALHEADIIDWYRR